MKRTNLFRVPANAAILLMLNGCNFAPKYDPPKTEPSPAYKEAVPGGDEAAQGWKLAEPRDAAIRNNWWEIYNDPQLDDLEARVAISNQTIVAAEASYRAAFALVKEAQAQLFPTLNTYPSATRQKNTASLAQIDGISTTGAAPSSPAAFPPHNIFELPLEATYQVDLWGSIRNTVAANRFSAESSAALLANALLSTQTTLAQDYFQLRVADEQRRILDKTVADDQLSLQLVRTLVESGVDSEADVASAESLLDAAMALATDAGVARAEFEHAIAVLIGVSPAQFSIPYKRLDQQLPIIPVTVPSDLLERRPDIASAERQVAQTNAQIGVAKAAFFPSLTLSATGGYESTAVNNLFNAPNTMWSVGPSLAGYIFDGGARRAALAQARALNVSQAATYRATVLSAFQSVEDELAALRILAVELGQAHQATDAAQRALDLTLVLFRTGVDSYVQLVTAEIALLSTRETELGVQLKQLSASVFLVNDLGGGWDVKQLPQTERMANHPPDAGKPAQVPAENSGAPAANPPPMPPGEVQPDQIFEKIYDIPGPKPKP
jgi:NodT family efflux transporter outer membrane factor (OMF) lipoprotein